MTSPSFFWPVKLFSPQILKETSQGVVQRASECRVGKGAAALPSNS